MDAEAADDGRKSAWKQEEKASEVTQKTAGKTARKRCSKGVASQPVRRPKATMTHAKGKGLPRSRIGVRATECGIASSSADRVPAEAPSDTAQEAPA
jgi:hypothetical protein